MFALDFTHHVKRLLLLLSRDQLSEGAHERAQKSNPSKATGHATSARGAHLLVENFVERIAFDQLHHDDQLALKLRAARADTASVSPMPPSSTGHTHGIAQLTRTRMARTA